MLLIALIDRLVPEYENPHEMTYLDGDSDRLAADSGKMMRMGLITALAISIHNFPEGMATFVSALQGGRGLALPITMAIAIHNIPEGVAVAVPLFYATGSRKKALGYSLLSACPSRWGRLSATCCCAHL